MTWKTMIWEIAGFSEKIARYQRVGGRLLHRYCLPASR
jgi:hypothetical protein